MLDNKSLGTAFEREAAKQLQAEGCWVHFLTPDNRGAQPFDLLAVKMGVALAIDCKTCADHYFRLSRLEENQRLAFDRWMKAGNGTPYLLVKHHDHIYWLRYDRLKLKGKIDLREVKPWR